MRWLLVRTLALIVLLTIAVSVGVLIGRAQPPPPNVAFLHLDECQLPCWIGIVPGKTTLTEAKKLISVAFPQELGELQYDEGVWHYSFQNGHTEYMHLDLYTDDTVLFITSFDLIFNVPMLNAADYFSLYPASPTAFSIYRAPDAKNRDAIDWRFFGKSWFLNFIGYDAVEQCDGHMGVLFSDQIVRIFSGEALEYSWEAYTPLAKWRGLGCYQ